MRDLNVPAAEMKAIQFLLHIALIFPLILRCYTNLMQLATSMFFEDQPIGRKVKTSKAAQKSQSQKQWTSYFLTPLPFGSKLISCTCSPHVTAKFLNLSEATCQRLLCSERCCSIRPWDEGRYHHRVLRSPYSTSMVPILALLLWARLGWLCWRTESEGIQGRESSGFVLNGHQRSN